MLVAELLHLPDKPAGVVKSRGEQGSLAAELLHLPGKPAGFEAGEDVSRRTAGKPAGVVENYDDAGAHHSPLTTHHSPLTTHPPMLEKIKKWLTPGADDEELRQKLAQIRQKTPIPVFWLYGKTQSGKTSLIKFLTGADEAEIGEGFKPCTRFSRQYHFPTAEAPLLTFLDTRGMDEPGYDPREDLAHFDGQAHVVIITSKVMDHALENLLTHLRPIREARPARPVVLALTCLHEAYPQRQHPQPYPFSKADCAFGQAGSLTSDNVGQASRLFKAQGIEGDDFSNLKTCLAEQIRRFHGLCDFVVPIDFTQPIDGYQDVHYGGQRLREVLLEALPDVYRQALIALDQATGELQDLFARRARCPIFLGTVRWRPRRARFQFPGSICSSCPASRRG